MNTTSNSTPPWDFSGDIAIHYEQCLGPLFFEPYGIEVAKRIDPSSIRTALEIASGTGRVTRHLRKKIPASSLLIASDISKDMLSVAKEKLKDYNIDWQIIDAQQLPFSDSSIDLVVCCFGYMFIPDKSKAFAESYRALRPGGMLLITTWDKLELNSASYAYRKTAEEYLGPFPESYNLAFSMNDQSIIRSFLENAGFSKITIEQVKQNMITSTAKEAVDALSSGGGIYNEIMKRNPAWLDEIRAITEKELSEKYGKVPMIAPMSAVFAQAWK